MLPLLSLRIPIFLSGLLRIKYNTSAGHAPHTPSQPTRSNPASQASWCSKSQPEHPIPSDPPPIFSRKISSGDTYAAGIDSLHPVARKESGIEALVKAFDNQPNFSLNALVGVETVASSPGGRDEHCVSCSPLYIAGAMAYQSDFMKIIEGFMASFSTQGDWTSPWLALRTLPAALLTDGRESSKSFVRVSTRGLVVQKCKGLKQHSPSKGLELLQHGRLFLIIAVRRSTAGSWWCHTAAQSMAMSNMPANIEATSYERISANEAMCSLTICARLLPAGVAGLDAGRCRPAQIGDASARQNMWT
ncbi:hypothetical protein AC579_2930 [Pseudocercospora musae]|uniref:Uncharacterized protein n=1 Tax=Pseudocercospora musae TaxID=113226 RepID=A0A139IUC1_9PEZI|nr:hypothetical protein AC579_2930 [Pseudocercospora musae]